MNNRICLFFLWVLFCLPWKLFKLEAQYSYSYQNYSIHDYQGGNQNWDIHGDARKRLYVANNEGLLEYNSIGWRLWTLPSKTIVRSVHVSGDKIYTGTYQDLGYWQRNEYGDLVYQSMSSWIQGDSIGSDEEIWQILEFGDYLIFRSFQKIYWLKGQEIRSFSLPSTIMNCSIVGERILISTLDAGIYSWKPRDEPSLLFQSPQLKGQRIVHISEEASGLFLVTENSACYVWHSDRLHPWRGGVNQSLRLDQVNRYTELENGNKIFGTIKNGMYLTDKEGDLIYHVNRATGLVNNTVLGQHVSEDNILWLGFDNGMAWIDLNTSNYFFKDASGYLGGVYDVIAYQDDIYIGSNTGLYYLDTDDHSTLHFIEGSQGQVWDLQVLAGDLICGHNNGTYLVRDRQLVKISDRTGGWRIKPISEEENMYLQGSYTGLVRFHKRNGQWAAKHVEGLLLPIRFFVFENSHTLWVAHANKGLYRIKLSKDYSQVVEMKDYSKHGLLSSHAVRIEKIKNTIVFHTAQGWQKYDAIRDSIVWDDYLNQELGSSSYLISEPESTPLWYKRDNLIIMKEQFSPLSSVFIPNYYYKNKLLSGYENISQFTDSTYFLNLYDGFMIIKPNEFRNKKQLPSPQIDFVTYKGVKQDISAAQIQIPYQDNHLGVQVSSFFLYDHMYEYRLGIDKRDTTWNRLEGNILQLSNLADGAYTLSFRAIAPDMEPSIPIDISLVVMPPYYKSRVAYLIYTIIGIGLFWFLYLGHKRRIEKQKNKIQGIFQAEQEKLLAEKELESKQKIMQLKNENLQRELDLKRKELANSAMSLVKKNEVLMDIKRILNSTKQHTLAQQTLHKLHKVIDFNLEHEADWKLFESNFNLVHEAFMVSLKQKHPQLSARDLKLCAYIKMDLTTKEIAPLLNISIRGVETYRYRLKKKLDIEEENVNDYLKSF